MSYAFGFFSFFSHLVFFFLFFYQYYRKVGAPKVDPAKQTNITAAPATNASPATGGHNSNEVGGIKKEP